MATANLVLVVITVTGFFLADVGYDWLIYREAGRRVFEGGLYDWSGAYTWSYSPLLAYAFVVAGPIGFLGWSILHGAALLALRPRVLALLTALLWPFWVDVYNGNTMTFVLVAGAGALQARAWGTWAYLLLCLLMPRPVMLPLLAWILWRQPEWRFRFATLAVVSGIAVLATGYAESWLRVLFQVGTAVAASDRAIGPSLLLGPWWLAIGAVLAIVLTLAGRVGLASLAASPYWLPQYLLMLVLEAVPRTDIAARRQSSNGIRK